MAHGVEHLLGVWLEAPDADRLRAAGGLDAHLHATADAVCPRCLRWIEADQAVRRTAYGPIQHEACPAADGPST